jgi:hypothetical protein
MRAPMAGVNEETERRCAREVSAPPAQTRAPARLRVDRDRIASQKRRIRFVGRLRIVISSSTDTPARSDVAR